MRDTNVYRYLVVASRFTTIYQGQRVTLDLQEMDSASQPDSPSEWSKFAPLPQRLHSSSPLSETENLTADTPCAETAPTETTPAQDPIKSSLFEITDTPGARGVIDSSALPADQFVCQNRKCKERRERRALAPRPLFAAHWRALRIGKRQALVLDLMVRCPDCELEHVYTLVPPAWLEVER